MDSTGIEEKVEGIDIFLPLALARSLTFCFYAVNQRHLIDKILARYSAEYVLYRELMQNAGITGCISRHVLVI